MKNILLTVLGLVILSGCESFLDKIPSSDLSQGSYFKDKSEMKNWNAGIYDAFQNALYTRSGYWGEVRSDNVQDFGGYSPNWIYYNGLIATRAESSWEYIYKCITRCNTGIEMYPTIPNILESEYAPYIGQCYGMRAYMYFYATRVWGKLPVIEGIWNGSLESKNTPRSSLENVKQQILDDVTMALSYLGTDVSDRYYVNRATMYALLTDVYMWYNEYQNALDASEYFINNSNFTLAQNETEWHDIFVKPGTTGNEVIFAMAWNKTADGTNSGWPVLYGASDTNNGFKIAQPLFTEFVDRLRSGEGRDSRFWNTLDTVAIYWGNSRVPISHASYSGSATLNDAIRRCIKYSTMNAEREYDSATGVYKTYYEVLNSRDCEQKLIMFRLSNIMYLRAEALNQLGYGDEALEIVNTLRRRVGYLKDAKQEASAADKYAVESIILLERQLEFYGEGLRWFDLMRTGRLVSVMNPIYSDRQADAGVSVTGFGNEGTKYWPIYYREFESNSALIGDQNPPYTER